MTRKSSLLAKLIICIAVALFTVAILGGYNYYYIKMVDNLSLFLPTGAFWSDMTRLPGGLLAWAGSYMTQFFYHPWLGACVYGACLVGLMLLMQKAYRLPARCFALSGAGAAMLLLGLLEVGYVMYSLKSPGFAYSNVLGTAVAAAIFWAYRSLRAWWLRLALMVVVIATYPWIGFYALLSIATFALYEAAGAIWSEDKTARIASAAIAAFGVIAIWLSPKMFWQYGTQMQSKAEMYVSGLPAFYDGEGALWIPYIILFALMGFMAFWAMRWRKDAAKPRTALIFTSALLAVSLACVWAFQAKDANFRATLEMDCALSDLDWQGVVDAREKLDETPTRITTLYTYMALMRQGKASDKMFAYVNGAAPYATSRTSTVMRDIATFTLNYHFGRVHSAYRWAMEYAVEYGLKAEYLKRMAKCAILFGEPKLAQKYLDALSHTMYHKEWAKRYQKYIDDPDAIAEDPEFKLLRPLMYYRDHIGGDGGKLESNLMPLYASMNGGTPEIMELAMQACLMQKNIDEFMNKFVRNWKSMKRIPVHFQEAVLLWSMVNNNNAYQQFPIDKNIMQRFQRFHNLSKNRKDYSTEQNYDLFKAQYGDTYWFYFFFTLGLKTS